MGAAGKKIRIVVADDHPVLRRGVERTLSRDDDIEIAGEAGDLDQLMRLLGAIEPPDVVLLDLGMPGAVGVAPIQRVRGERPSSKILVYTMYEERQVGIRCLKAGAHGFLPKSSPTGWLVEAIRAVAAGRRYISTDLAEQLIERVPDPRTELPQALLTERELEILLALASGTGTRELAEKLELSVKTIHTHRARVLEKLQLRSTVDLVHYAVEHRLLGWTPEPLGDS